jgi:hypothetical protein
MRRWLLIGGAALIALLLSSSWPARGQINLGSGGSSLTVGTADIIPKWNSTPDDLVDSAFEDPGNDAYVNVGSGFAFRVRAVTTSRHVFSAATGTFNTTGYLNIYADQGNGIAQEIDYTIAAQDGSDTGRALFIDIDNSAGATGSSNLLYGIDIDSITGDAQASEYAINIGSGYDAVLNLASTGGITTIISDDQIYIQTASNQGAVVFFDAVLGIRSFLNIDADDTLRGSLGIVHGTDLAIVGAAQTIDPNSEYVEIGAGAGASVTSIANPINSYGIRLTLFCKDANVTINDSDQAGAANTIDLAGAATNFTCSDGDTLTLAFLTAPGTGNARWVELARSVN